MRLGHAVWQNRSGDRENGGPGLAPFSGETHVLDYKQFGNNAGSFPQWKG